MKTITFRLTEDVDAQLESLLTRKGTTRSALIRDAIESYLSRAGAADSPSFLELCREMAGGITGPADLSVGKKHLEGYGL